MEAHATDTSRHLWDTRLAFDHSPILEDGIKTNGLFRCGKHTAFDRENLRGLAQRRLHIASDLRHCREKEIAEAVPRKVAVPCKSILKEFLHQRLCIGKCNETVAQIPRWDDAQLLTQPPRGTSVVCNGHDGCHIARQLFDATQEHGEAMPSADHCDRRSAAEPRLFIDEIHQTRRSPLRHERRDDRANDMTRR